MIQTAEYFFFDLIHKLVTLRKQVLPGLCK